MFAYCNIPPISCFVLPALSKFEIVLEYDKNSNNSSIRGKIFQENRLSGGVMNMSNPVFVGRKNELRELNGFLDSAAQGKTQVALITGEAGAGKSALVAEFVRRAETVDPKLIAALGECNSQTGIADPYLPFRQVLASLTTAEEEHKPSKQADPKKVSRWKEFVQISTKTLMMLGPDLVGIFLPGSQFFTRIGTTIALNSNLAIKLSDKLGKKLGEDTLKSKGELDQEKIFEQYAAVLKDLAKDRTLIIVLDDLQWADEGSIALFFHLSRQLKDCRILLLGAYRSDEVALGRAGGRHPLETVINELKRYYGEIVIDLTQVRKDEGRAFVDALLDAEPNTLGAGFREELYNRTGGHPLFTVELLRNLQESGGLVKDADGRWIQGDRLEWENLPARIDGVFGERLARLSPDLRETLRIGSVMGQEFAAQVVGQIQKVDERQMVSNLSRELEKRYLLVAEMAEIKIGGHYLSQYRFTHNLLQKYLYNELGGAERRMLHAEIAEVLESYYGEQAESIALQLAHHHEAAGNDQKAIDYLICAGDGALRVYAHNEAVAAYTRALELGRQTSPGAGSLTHLYLNRGRALELSNQYQAALDNYQEMTAASQKLSDQSMELAAKVAASTLYSTPTFVANASRGQELSEETLALARKLGDRATEAKVLWNLQLVNLLQNKASQAIEYGEQSLSIARELDLREQMAYVLSDLGWAYNVACQFDKSDERLEEGARILRELGNKPMLLNNLNTSLFGLFWAGNNGKVLKTAEEAIQLSTDVKDVWNRSSARNFEGLVWLEQGDIDKGLEALEDSIHTAGELNKAYMDWYRAQRYQAYGELGAAALLRDNFRSNRVPNADILPSPFRTSWLLCYAVFEMTSGDIDAAAATLSVCEADAAPWEAQLQIVGGRLALTRQDLTTALALADKAVAITRQYALGQFLPAALYLKGKSLALCGEVEPARRMLEQARIEAEKIGSRRLLWQILSLSAGVEPDEEQSRALKSEASKTVRYIADHITQPDLRASFIGGAEVSALLAVENDPV
jgi:predicted ATPase